MKKEKMVIKNIKINFKEVVAIKDTKKGGSGEIYVTLISLLRALGFDKKGIDKNKAILTAKGLAFDKRTVEKGQLIYIININDSTKVLKTLETDNEIISHNIFKVKKTFKTKIKSSLKRYRPVDIEEMINDNKVKTQLNKIKDEGFHKEYSRIKNNLYGMKVDKKLNVTRNAESAWNKTTRKKFSEFDKVQNVILKDVMKLKDARARYSKRRMEKLQQKNEKELKMRRPVYDFDIQSTRMKSYNHGLEARNSKIYTKKSFKAWQTEIDGKLRIEGVNDEYMHMRAVSLSENKKIRFDLVVKLHTTKLQSGKEKTPDADNYNKAFQDVLAKHIGINDSMFILNNMELQKVNSYKEQGYKFGLRLGE